MACATAVKTGERFGRLVVVAPLAARAPDGSVIWRCRCDCGAEKEIKAFRLRVDDQPTRSCGCLQREVTARISRTHGHSTHGRVSPEYQSWRAMRYRCTNPHSEDYENYGARGIGVCARWNDFAAFLADMGPKPEGLTIDRIDNNRGYEPGNCRWADYSTQNKNRRPFKRARR